MRKQHPFVFTMSVMCLSVMMISALVACDQTDNHNMVDSNVKNPISKESVFIGCYTVNPSEPAQIKISHIDNQFVMQMKQSPISKMQPNDEVWDIPEPLEPVAMTEVSDYFYIEPDQVDVMLARKDRMLVMANVKPEYVNLNPTLDSEYLAFIYKGANTVYKVACETPIKVEGK